MASKIRVNFESTEDVGIVTHYRGKPFTGIGYLLYKNGKLKNEIVTHIVFFYKYIVLNLCLFC